MGQRKKIQAVPAESRPAMIAALCEMYFNIGVSTDWHHPENVLLRISKTDDRKKEVDEDGVL